MSITLRVWGDFACFTNPAFKTERTSYPVITPSAARGVLEAIYRKPEMQWIIDSLKVINPINYTAIPRNEVAGGIILTKDGNIDKPYYGAQENRVCRTSNFLTKVEYCITAHLICKQDTERANPPQKHYAQFNRRASNGGYFNPPYLGCRECMAYFRLITGEKLPDTHFSLTGQLDLGTLFLDFDYSQRPYQPRFFNAVMIDGVIAVPPPPTTI